MTDPAMPPDLDRLLGAATVPAMSAGLIDRIVAEAQRPDRMALPVPPARRAHARAWTRRGVRTGIVAVGLMLATAVAAAFGGGALSVAKIRAVAQHVVERIRHPFHHAAPVVAPVHRVVHRMRVPSEAIHVGPARIGPGFAPHPYAPLAIPRPIPSRGFVGHPPIRTPQPALAHAGRMLPVAQPRARFAAGHPFARRVPVRPSRIARPPRREPGFDRSPGIERPASREPGIDRAPVAAPTEPRRASLAIAPAATASQRAPAMGLRGDGGTRFDGPRWRDPARFGGGPDPRGPGWRRRMGGGGGVAGAGPQGWRRARPAGGIRPFRPGGGRRPRRF